MLLDWEDPGTVEREETEATEREDTALWPSILDAQYQERLLIEQQRAERDALPWDWSFLDRDPFQPTTREFARRMQCE